MEKIKDIKYDIPVCQKCVRCHSCVGQWTRHSGHQMRPVQQVSTTFVCQSSVSVGTDMSLQSYIYFNVYCFNADRISLCYAPVCIYMYIWGNLLGGGGPNFQEPTSLIVLVIRYLILPHKKIRLETQFLLTSGPRVIRRVIQLLAFKFHIGPVN